MDTPARKGAKRERAIRLVALQAIAAIACTTVMSFLPARAESELSGGDTARARIDFRVVIPTVFRVDAVAQPERLVIDERHVAQGYVDLDEASRVRLTSNGRNGFDVSVSFDSRLLQRVVVRMPGGEILADAEGAAATMPNPPQRSGELRVGYRLYLAPQARTGTHPWPVGLRFSPSTV